MMIDMDRTDAMRCRGILGTQTRSLADWKISIY